MKETKIEEQKYNKFHEKHKAPVKRATVNVPADIAEFVMGLGDGNWDMLNMSRDKGISDCFDELVAHPMESKNILDSIMFNYMELVVIPQAAPVSVEEIRLFACLSDFFNACFKFKEGRKNKRGGLDE